MCCIFFFVKKLWSMCFVLFATHSITAWIFLVGVVVASNPPQIPTDATTTSTANNEYVQGSYFQWPGLFTNVIDLFVFAFACLKVLYNPCTVFSIQVPVLWLLGHSRITCSSLSKSAARLVKVTSWDSTSGISYRPRQPLLMQMNTHVMQRNHRYCQFLPPLNLTRVHFQPGQWSRGDEDPVLWRASGREVQVVLLQETRSFFCQSQWWMPSQWLQVFRWCVFLLRRTWAETETCCPSQESIR